MLSPSYNHTVGPPATFFLVGIPGLQSSYLWLAISLSAMYTTALLGNTLIMTVICMDSTLQEPMYCFLCVLAAVDIVMASSVAPKMVSIFSSGDGSISFNACFTQMYFVHTSTAVETGLLLAMAFDRYVAICKPLHYTRILTPHVMLGMCVTIIIRAIIFMTPLSWMLGHLPFCGSNVVPHSYCEHMAVAKLSCADPMPSSLYSLIFSSIIVGSDVAFIAASYTLILREVLSLSSKNAQQKAFSTCCSHVGVMALYYLPGMASIYVAWLGQDSVPSHTQVLLADLYLVIPPTSNPIIYGIRTKQIRERIWSLLMHVFFGQSNQGS
uniref:Olfactory receptor n=1 Tax=Nannospalax galili TaxID=1026970 RepID=A0A0N9P7C3_NANGA|nr:olfactory receptor 16 [Nannospalax galili]ALG94530.1 olfactory receptor 16 [Nannospalax galili]ALG94531.1 olfactory receptor 16 [Nannospalax galili]ALG94540.1 olfactory receptor 16 [Nannospalax galili]ALG94554.1 olfactory receptor 16 [Nannospalax galili]